MKPTKTKKEIKITTPIYHTIQFKTKKDKTILLWQNWYWHAHFITKNNIKRWFKETIADQINKLTPFTNQIDIHYVYYFKRKWVDLNNVHSVISKFFPDAIVELWKITDDTVEFMPDARETFWGYDKDNPRAEIFIREL